MTRFPPLYETVYVCLVDGINICICSSRDPKACSDQSSSFSQRNTNGFSLQETIKNKQGIQKFRQCRGGRYKSAAHSSPFGLISWEILCLMWLQRKLWSPNHRGKSLTHCWNGLQQSGTHSVTYAFVQQAFSKTTMLKSDRERRFKRAFIKYFNLLNHILAIFWVLIGNKANKTSILVTIVYLAICKMIQTLLFLKSGVYVSLWYV